MGTDVTRAGWGSVQTGRRGGSGKPAKVLGSPGSHRGPQEQLSQVLPPGCRYICFISAPRGGRRTAMVGPRWLGNAAREGTQTGRPRAEP